jgi:hypothetical protein
MNTAAIGFVGAVVFFLIIALVGAYVIHKMPKTK